MFGWVFLVVVWCLVWGGWEGVGVFLLRLGGLVVVFRFFGFWVGFFLLGCVGFFSYFTLKERWLGRRET